MTAPTRWSEAAPGDLRRIRGVCLDIDETLSTHGKLTGEAYSALWELKRAGLAVVPITGRPAGWCDHIARFWPVDAVVGENGAFTFFMQDGRLRRLTTPGAEADPKPLLEQLGRKIRQLFPEAVWASDQAYREYDLAIDVCEDVPPWPRSQVEDLLALCQQAGAHAKLSSIHVNAWFGDYDKRRGFEHWLAQGAPGLNPAATRAAAVQVSGPAPMVTIGGRSLEALTPAAESAVPVMSNVPGVHEWLFIGDSPNDEPMFATFPSSVGVANLAQYVDRLKTPPRWITARESGGGFAEMAQRLLAARGGVASAT